MWGLGGLAISLLVLLIKIRPRCPRCESQEQSAKFWAGESKATAAVLEKMREDRKADVDYYRNLLERSLIKAEAIMPIKSAAILAQEDAEAAALLKQDKVVAEGGRVFGE